MARYVALLRGINVGGARKLPMKELRALCADVGCDDPETYIQSGNLVFSASAAHAKSVPTALREAIEARYGYEVPVVVRSARDWARITSTNPFPKGEEDPKLLHVAFLHSRPKKAALEALDPERSPGDQLAVAAGERELYVWYANGASKTKLDHAYLERCLGVANTMRNWRTVRALADML